MTNLMSHIANHQVALIYVTNPRVSLWQPTGGADICDKSSCLPLAANRWCFYLFCAVLRHFMTNPRVSHRQSPGGAVTHFVFGTIIIQLMPFALGWHHFLGGHNFLCHLRTGHQLYIVIQLLLTAQEPFYCRQPVFKHKMSIFSDWKSDVTLNCTLNWFWALLHNE